MAILILLGMGAPGFGITGSEEEARLQEIRLNARQASEGFRRCERYMRAWLAETDPDLDLVPRNLQKDRDVWNAHDSAADNYPFLVLTAFFVDPGLLEGRLLEMLETERKVAARWGPLPDAISLSEGEFLNQDPDGGAIIFGASEYVKDGLLPLTEWLGESHWSRHMLTLLDEIWSRAPVQTEFGVIPSESPEINGEMLQALARVYWMTGEERYLDWALRLGDYYLLSEHHITRHSDRLRLRDHGCEVVSGLCELYATVSRALPAKKMAYQKPLHEALDRILQTGRNDDGLFYNVVNPMTGEVLDSGVADTWGYTLNGYYTVHMIDGIARYREAVLKALEALNGAYRDFDWEHGSADGYADSIESALNLFNREPSPPVAEWIDSEILNMWEKQQPSGIIEGWHGDGNFARTTLMYCLWKTKGVYLSPWKPTVTVGGVQHQESLHLEITSEEAWSGRLVFDAPRHRTHFGLPFDWPRINQFPEWFTVDRGGEYVVTNLNSNEKRDCVGADLLEGFPIVFAEPESIRLAIQRKSEIRKDLQENEANP
jgi:hypothetical protein